MTASQQPSLEELYEVLDKGDTDSLQQLRSKFKWMTDSKNFFAPEQTSDSMHNRLLSLLENFGPNCLSCKNKNGSTLVHVTAQTCETEAALDLILARQGGEGNPKALDCFRAKREDGWSAVHFAALNTNLCALKWLVAKLDSNCLYAKTNLNNLPIHYAAWKQASADHVKFIASELGAACLHKIGSDNRNVFHFAALNEKSNAPLKWIFSEIGSNSLKVKDANGNTPMHLAAWKQDVPSMYLMRQAFGDLMFTLPGENGELVQHCAAQNTANPSVLAWCIKEMGPTCLLAKNAHGRIPCHLAARFGTEKNLQMIVDALGDCACLAVEDSEKKSAAHFAAMNESGNGALRWIVAKLGPDCLKQPDAEGSMPVHMAAWWQGVDSLAFVRDCLGCEAFHWKGSKGWTMAHFAAENYAKTELLAWIVKEVGPQCLLVPDEDGVTPEELAGLCE